MILQVENPYHANNFAAQNKIMNFNGDIAIVNYNLLDEIAKGDLRSYDWMMIEVCTGAEWDYPIFDGDNILGYIDDWRGSCELCVFYTKDLLRITNSQSVNDMLDKLYIAYRNNNFARTDINPGATYPQIFEIKDFNGSVEVGMLTNSDDVYEITVSFKGVNTSTGEAINYELKEHDY